MVVECGSVMLMPGLPKVPNAYKMTINDSNYKIAAVIGIMVFLVTAVISLIVYNTMPSVKDEEGFQ